MKKFKAIRMGKSIQTYDGFSLMFMYRGETYFVEYNTKYGNAMGSTPREQHREEQKRIDEMLENKKDENEKPNTHNPIDLDEIWEMLGW